jgi:hypothetical protein
MYLKIHQTSNGSIIAVCDENLIGKVLKNKKVCMDLGKYKDFYVGSRANESEVRRALERFSSANIVGEESVGVAISMGLVGKEVVMYINKTPYIQIYKL